MTDSIKTISRIRRLRSSTNGNPKFEIGFDDATTAKTQTDSAFCYAVGNPDMRVGSRVVVRYSKSGTIAGMGPAS